MQAGELNTRVTLLQYANIQDQTTGVLTPSLIAQWDKWAKVEHLSESRALQFAGISYNGTYKFTVRYERSRPTRAFFNIEFEGEQMKIFSVIKKAIGFAWFEEILAYN